MKFINPQNTQELLNMIDVNEQNYFLAGGTDINVQLKKGMIKKGTIFHINHLPDFSGIVVTDEIVSLGALTTYREISENIIIKKNFPFLEVALQNFASPLLTTMATIGGNIANGSPTNDVTPPLLVLDAELELISRDGRRNVALRDFFTGYKKTILKKNELIKSILIKKDAEYDFDTFYRKVGARETLTIAKVSVAGLKRIKNNSIKEIKLAVGSVNEFPRRLKKLEKYLNGKLVSELSKNEIAKILKQEITPITDLRSDKEYRYQVCLNLIEQFVF